MQQIGNFGGGATAKETIIKYKAVRETVTSNTTLQNDDHLFCTLKGNTTYLIEGVLVVNTQSSGGIKLRLSQGGSVDAIYQYESVGIVGANTSWASTNPNTSAQLLATGSFLKISGYIQTNSNAHTIQLEWAQNTSNATGTYLEKGSYIKFTEV